MAHLASVRLHHRDGVIIGAADAAVRQSFFPAQREFPRHQHVAPTRTLVVTGVTMLSRKDRNRARAVALLSMAGGLWLLASLPSGFSMAQIAVFAGPGIVLALATDWASHVIVRRDFNWAHGLQAAAIGGTIFPPFVALFFAWSGSFGPNLLVTLLVFSAWLALFCGLAFAGLSWLAAHS
jgi:hypothetical protein